MDQQGNARIQGSAGFTSNSYGLLRGDVGIIGPLKSDFSYSLSALFNIDPMKVEKSNRNVPDKTDIRVINKRWFPERIPKRYSLIVQKLILQSTQ